MLLFHKFSHFLVVHTEKVFRFLFKGQSLPLAQSHPFLMPSHPHPIGGALSVMPS